MTFVNYCAILIFSALIYFLYKFCTATFNNWKRLNIQGPTPTALVGNYMSVVLNKEHSAVLSQKIYNEYPSEKFVGIYRLRTPVLLIRDLDIVKDILIKDFEFFQDRGLEFSKEGLGANLFHSDGDTWNLLRKRMNPLFTSSKLKRMFHLIKDRADELIKYIDETAVDGEATEISDYTAKYTAEVLGRTSYGININAFNNNPNRFLEIGDKQLTANIRLTILSFFPELFKFFNMDLFSYEVREHYNKLVSAIFTSRAGKPKVRHDFMDILLELKEEGQVSGNKFKSDAQVQLEITQSVMAAQMFIIFGAGYETTASTMACLLHELALNPDIQHKLINEIDEVLERYAGEISMEAIHEMHYLEKVFLETMRKYPVLDVMRKSVRDYKIAGTDIILPKGTHILIPLLGIHGDPKYYPDPEKFDPERFLPENNKNRHSCAYIPFGEGPRICIGMRFGRTEVLLGIVCFLRKFKVECCEKTKPKIAYVPPRYTLQADGGIWLKLKRR